MLAGEGDHIKEYSIALEVFGRRDAPVVISWVFAGHQVGGALAAFGAGAGGTSSVAPLA